MNLPVLQLWGLSRRRNLSDGNVLRHDRPWCCTSVVLLVRGQHRPIHWTWQQTITPCKWWSNKNDPVGLIVNIFITASFWKDTFGSVDINRQLSQVCWKHITLWSFAAYLWEGNHQISQTKIYSEKTWNKLPLSAFLPWRNWQKLPANWQTLTLCLVEISHKLSAIPIHLCTPTEQTAQRKMLMTCIHTIKTPI